MESQGPKTTKRVPVSQIRTGMYVVSLDRSWIDTPFFFHRKLIKSSKDIELLKKYGIREVVIDTRLGADIDIAADSDTAGELTQTDAPRPAQDAAVPAVEIRHATAGSVEFKFMVQEFDVARKIHDDALAATQSIFDGAGRGAPINAAVAAKVVSDLSGTVLRSPEASLLLTQMRRFQGDLFAHSVNVCVLSLVIGAAEGFEGDNAILGLGALLHDLGQTRLPRNLIRKQAPYTESERRLVEQHPTLGYNAIQHLEHIPEQARRIVLEHHERADGSGYPAKAQG